MIKSFFISCLNQHPFYTLLQPTLAWNGALPTIITDALRAIPG
jgi:hypothetical protein